jgi:hypothetical protein
MSILKIWVRAGTNKKAELTKACTGLKNIQVEVLYSLDKLPSNGLQIFRTFKKRQRIIGTSGVSGSPYLLYGEH